MGCGKSSACLGPSGFLLFAVEGRTLPVAALPVFDKSGTGEDMITDLDYCEYFTLEALFTDFSYCTTFIFEAESYQ